METHGENATIRPWVWVALFFVGVLSKSVIQHRQLYIQTAIKVRMQVLLTQLVFDHSLRIRLKAEKSSEKAVSESLTSSTISIPERKTTQQPSTTASGSVSGGDAPSGNGNKQDVGSNSSVKGKSKEEAKEEIKKPTSDARNLLGRINNLITSDIITIAESSDFLTFGT